MSFDNNWQFIWPLLLLIWVVGFFASINAILTARTSQGAIAWAVSLITLPLIAFPLYWLFGQRKFYGYVKARRTGDLEINHVAEEFAQCHLPTHKPKSSAQLNNFRVLEKLVAMPFTSGNSADLLIDGEQTFSEIFAGIDTSRQYILVQFYSIADDEIGGQLKSRLIAKSKQGVKVYFLYDAIGSYQLSAAYINELSHAGVVVEAFQTIQSKHKNRRFQINFRNHRKIVIVDGQVAYVGGLNVGDEYLGKHPKMSPWRDTHLKVSGAVVQCVQLSFIEDWFWATGNTLQLNWTPTQRTENKNMLVLPTGPADRLETCNLFFMHLINSAKQRLWIISPYFVPDEQIISALQVAALRGVDVRVMLPSQSDNLLVKLASQSYIEELSPAGIHLYRYNHGFLHQKVMLVDDDISVIGTANIDNRSFRLNFEITMLVLDKAFAVQTQDMLEKDFEHCQPMQIEDWQHRSLVFKFICRVARLFAPLL